MPKSIKFSDNELGFLRSHYEQELIDAEMYVGEIRRILSKLGHIVRETPNPDQPGKKRRGRPAGAKNKKTKAKAEPKAEAKPAPVKVEKKKPGPKPKAKPVAKKKATPKPKAKKVAKKRGPAVKATPKVEAPVAAPTAASAI
jgi:hypothetical protein